MKPSSRFFENRDCEYFPCHKGLTDFNCLFCYCPFYLRDDCPGHPNYLETSKGIVKDCSGCSYPHNPAHYDAIMDYLRAHAYRKKEDAHED